MCVTITEHPGGVKQAMSPRPYQLGRRQADVDEGRRRVLDAARALLATTESFGSFTVEAVARAADVARATIYYQFGSKSGLLEAICDDLASSARMDTLAESFSLADPLEALHSFVAVFARFWDSDRAAMRRLRALAHLDPEVHGVISARDDRRRRGLTVLLGRLRDHPLASAADRPDAVPILMALTSFETFDALAGAAESCSAALPVIYRLIDAVLGDPAERYAEPETTRPGDQERRGGEEVSGPGAGAPGRRPAQPGRPG
jgi:AcrR family transcriptional regulator